MSRRGLRLNPGQTGSLSSRRVPPACNTLFPALAASRQSSAGALVCLPLLRRGIHSGALLLAPLRRQWGHAFCCVAESRLKYSDVLLLENGDCC